MPATAGAGRVARTAAALSASPYPVVLAGDLSSPPDPTADAYGVLTSAGFRDAWSRVGRGPGYTAASPPADDLTYDPGQIDHRVDDVLYRGCGLAPVSAEVVGDRPADRAPSGRWLSDHAGVVATVRLATHEVAGREADARQQEHRAGRPVPAGW
ncbi:MAG TPA: hypothetical protein VKP11_08050 [Frankiaceae bacterium]|nr:hypothetical protein [Frankiaceae bacterium]